MFAMSARLFVVLGIMLWLGACTQPAAVALSGPGPQLSPLYNVTPDMMRPDGLMRNGLLPMNPNDQS